MELRTSPTLSAHLLRALGAIAAATCALVCWGCLSQTHVVPKRDLQQLATLSPVERARRVRVIQQFTTSSEPPEAPVVSASTDVYLVSTPIHVHNAHHPPSPPKPSSGGKSFAQAKSAKAAWLVILAAGAALGLAATEGARYDGWVELHPMHPIHLYGPGGQYTWVPLAHLDPATAAWAQRAYVRKSEGPWRRIGRAPLDRQGWMYSVLAGVGELPSATGQEHSGFHSHIQIGYFPTQTVGVVADVAMGWTDNELGATLFDSRYSFELEILPLSAGRFHAGVFGQAGVAARFEDGAPERDDRDSSYGGGALLQLEITTRLTITARAGMTLVHDARSNDLTFGFSIY